MAKRTLAILLLLAGSAFAADSYYQIPSPEGSGKKMRSIDQSIGGNTVYQQNLLISDPTTSFVATVNTDGSLNTRLLSSATTVQTTTSTLTSGATFTSQTFDTVVAGHGFTVSAASDKNGHTYHDQSINGTDWISADDYYYTASAGHHEEHIAHTRYTRFRFVNDSGENQTSFTFSVIQRHMDGFGTVKISPTQNEVVAQGDKEHNTSAPLNTAQEALTAVAKAAAPTYTEGYAVHPRVTLSGDTAVTLDGETVPVTGTFWQATQPVSGTVACNAGTNLNTSSLALDASVTAMSGKLPASLGAKTGAASLSVVPSTDTSFAVTGTFWQGIQPVSGTFWQATQPVSGTFWQATQPVSGTVAVGSAADNSAAASNNAATLPTIVETSTTPITRTDGNRAALIEDADGKVYVRSFDWNPLFATTGLSTATTLTELIAVPGASVSVYITGWKCSSSAASTTTTDQQCTLKYGTGTNCGTGTTYVDGCFQGSNGGCAESMDSPIKLPANNALCWIHAAAGSKIVRVNYFLAP